MLGSKLRSWMEAVRPKKKQQRKEKQLKSHLTNVKFVPNSQSVHSSRSSENEILEDVDGKSMRTIASHAPRYSGANLSSPESAYSTGYSTDGTSPGAPPEYYINIRTGVRYLPSANQDADKRPGDHASLSPNEIVSPRSTSSPRAKLIPRGNLSPRAERVSEVAVHLNGDHATVSMTQDYDNSKNVPARTSVTLHNNLRPSNGVPPRLTEVVVNSGLTSPRQRNRIRTNPWVPGNNLSPGNSCVGLQTRQEFPKSTVINSPVPVRYLSPTIPRSPVKKCESLSSSSCSSLSAASLQWDLKRSPRISSMSDEDDCTLNEMMGKYDESYVYEKETDILSDSDPTDCETDIDTGQDGGDEEDPLEREFDFIDNGSYLEFNVETKDERNTGHCTYYNFEVQRKSSRRRTVRRSQKESQKESQKQGPRRRSSKKRHKKSEARPLDQCDGSRSAGATPLSVRRVKHPLSKLAAETRLKKRSNSVSENSISTFDRRDKEADKKYKELIVEAEHILMNMKGAGLSPRRLPGPANKRVELLRNAESAKPDVYIKNRLNEDAAKITKIPSNFVPSRFSPKKNHITNFINNNSPIMMRRDVEKTPDVRNSPLAVRRSLQSCLKTTPNSPLLRHQKADSAPRRYKKKLSKSSQHDGDSFSSDSEDDCKQKRHLIMQNMELNEFGCPQSEPVKRKVYTNRCKAVAFNLNYESICNTDTPNSNDYLIDDQSSCENMRQQVLLNTIANLKRSLEDQSASLRQVYRSSHNLQS